MKARPIVVPVLFALICLFIISAAVVSAQQQEAAAAVPTRKVEAERKDAAQHEAAAAAEQRKVQTPQEEEPAAAAAAEQKKQQEKETDRMREKIEAMKRRKEEERQQKREREAEVAAKLKKQVEAKEEAAAARAQREQEQKEKEKEKRQQEKVEARRRAVAGDMQRKREEADARRKEKEQQKFLQRAEKAALARQEREARLMQQAKQAVAQKVQGPFADGTNSNSDTGSNAASNTASAAAAAARAQQAKKQQQQPQQRKLKAQKVMGVVDLQASNFDASVRDGSVWLIEFYAPWCGHCKRFAPTYEKVAEQLHSLHAKQTGDDDDADVRNVMVARVDGAADRALASRFSIRGYPTFFLVDGWNVYEFEGERTLEDLVDFATEDYVEYDPIPFLHSPFGPMGQLRAMFILAGTKAISSFEWMVNEKGFSETAAAMLMIGSAIVAGMFLIIFIGLLSVAKPKTD